MHIQPIDVPSLLRALAWPLIVIFALIRFRRPLIDLVGMLGRNLKKVSFAGLSLELVEAPSVKPSALDTEIRRLDGGLSPQSGSSALSELITQLQFGGPYDYITIDLGSDSSPRWLTSRLYLLTFLVSFIHQPNCLVFLHTACDESNHFLGTASPDRVRWSLARRYPWLESASSAAYARAGGLYCSPNAQVQINPQGFQFDQTTGTLQNFQLAQCMQLFLDLIRLQPPKPGTSLAPVISAVSPMAGPVGTLVTITGVQFGDGTQPTNRVTFNGIPAVTASWTQTQIVTTVPSGATSGDLTVTALGLVGNAIPFTVGATDSAEWLALPNGGVEHAKWLNGSRIQHLLGNDLDTSHITLMPNQNISQLSDVVLTQYGQFVAVVDPDKTFQGLVDRSAVLERAVQEFLKRAKAANDS